MIKKRNWMIKLISVVLSMGMVALMCYTYIYSVQNKQEMFNNSYNSHQAMLAKQNTRGTIYANDGQILAITNTVEGTEVREYPYENLFSHVIGYSTKGKSGIESSYNYYLTNSNCSLKEKVDAELSEQKYPGDSIYTTLHVDLQKIAYETLGMYDGAIVVSEPSTGKILAMVSKPDFNPNEIEQNWNQLLEDKQSSILLNRATQGLYPPGSTFKIITALEYIRENKAAANSYLFECTGRITADNSTINCYHGSVHGTVDFAKSFAKSCNSSFANMGINLDKKEFEKTLNTLGFGESFSFEFPTAISSIEMNEETSIADTMQAAIGQGKDAMSPLHLNLITAAIANQGVAMKPYLVDRVVNNEGIVVKQFQPVSYRTLMTQQEAEVLTDLMQGVVENGTATKLKGRSYTAAGKTGSAEYNNIKGDSHAWFTGFAPVENPQIAVTVIIEGAGSGGDYAVPLARRIFDAYLDN